MLRLVFLVGAAAAAAGLPPLAAAAANPRVCVHEYSCSGCLADVDATEGCDGQLDGGVSPTAPTAIVELPFQTALNQDCRASYAYSYLTAGLRCRRLVTMFDKAAATYRVRSAVDEHTHKVESSRFDRP